MQITLSPQRRDDTLAVTKQADALTINGRAYDFSIIPDGATLPKDATDCDWLASDVKRIDGVLHLSLILPNSDAASEAARFPDPLVDPADGPLYLPDQAVSDITETTYGVIDLGALIFPISPIEILADWRENGSIPRAEFCVNANAMGLLVDADAEKAAAGAWPDAFEPIIAAWPLADRIRARAKWADNPLIYRSDPLLALLAGATGLAAEQIDVLCGWTG